MNGDLAANRPPGKTAAHSTYINFEVVQVHILAAARPFHQGFDILTLVMKKYTLMAKPLAPPPQ